MSADTAKESDMSTPEKDPGVKLVAYPKIIFMWPTWLVALAGAVFLTFVGEEGNTGLLS